MTRKEVEEKTQLSHNKKVIRVLKTLELFTQNNGNISDSELARLLTHFNIESSSSTVGRDLRAELSMIFPKLYIHHIKIKEAIEKEVLPSPKVILLPLKLDNTKKEYLIIKNRNRRFYHL